MKLEILTPESNVFSGEVKLIKVPGSKGSFELLTNHAPIISTLEAGKLKIIDLQNKETIINVSGGVIECHQNSIVVLADSIL